MVAFSDNSIRNTEFKLLIPCTILACAVHGLFLMRCNDMPTLYIVFSPLILFLAFSAAHLANRNYAPRTDPIILPIVFVLSSIGITFLANVVPKEVDRQFQYLLLSIFVMIFILILVPTIDEVVEYKYTIATIGLLFLLVPLLLGVEEGGEMLWLSFRGTSIQPGELTKVCLAIFLGGYLAEYRSIISNSTQKAGPYPISLPWLKPSEPLSIPIPRLRVLVPMGVIWLLSFCIVAIEKDLGFALIIFTLYFVMLYACTKKPWYFIVWFALLMLGGSILYPFVGRLQERVNAYMIPFEYADSDGYQIVQSLFALADGGIFGVGIGRGIPSLVPIADSDFIFAIICEETGAIGGFFSIALYLTLALRGLIIAGRSHSDKNAFTAISLSAVLFLQAFINMGGVTKLIPLTGVTLPFVSKGGSSLVTCFIIIALLLRAGNDNDGEHENRYGGRPSLEGSHDIMHNRYYLHKNVGLAVIFIVMSCALAVSLCKIQIIDAADYRSRPENMYAASRAVHVQRGAIRTSDGVTLAESIPNDNGYYTRSHPQGDVATNIVGYYTSQYGSSGIEALMNGALSGSSEPFTLKRLFYSLVGKEMPGATVVLTINYQMQQIVEEALAGYYGSVVVLDPSTGAILACASSPTFTYDNVGDILSSNSDDGEFINRATDALYPPGSTFKVVTLAAALQAGTAELETVFSAPAELEIGEGTIYNIHEEYWEQLSLRQALMYSANTVYAQLGEQIGADTLVNYATAFGYGSPLGQDLTATASLVPNSNEMTLWETAWAACGQPVGEHESPAGPQTTVLQNAVIAAAIANGGEVLNPYVIDSIQSAEGKIESSTSVERLSQPISSDTAYALGTAMLDVVDGGTGTAAGGYGLSVAGKTGTAETDAKNSNSLFIGFAPYDNPTLAISVCIEGGDSEVSGVATVLAGKVLAACFEIQEEV